MDGRGVGAHPGWGLGAWVLPLQVLPLHRICLQGGRADWGGAPISAEL